MADETTGAQRLTLADMAKEMRQRASFADLALSTRELLLAWAEALEREYADMTTEYERLCRDYDMAMEALKQDERLLMKRLPATSSAIRPVVQWFAEHMECELRANDHKPGWQHDSVVSLLARTHEELTELSECLHSGDGERIVSEAADVANFAMMLADVAQLRN